MRRLGTNWKQNFKNWIVMSSKNNFFSQQLQLLLPQCMPQLGGNLHFLFLESRLLRKINWQLCSLRWHFERKRRNFPLLLPPLMTEAFLMVIMAPVIHKSLMNKVHQERITLLRLDRRLLAMLCQWLPVPQ